MPGAASGSRGAGRGSVAQRAQGRPATPDRLSTSRHADSRKLHPVRDHADSRTERERSSYSQHPGARFVARLTERAVMKEPDSNDWKELEAAWHAHDADPQLMESTLRSRMHAQRWLVLHAIGEGASFLLAAGVWSWVVLKSHAPILGWMMLGAL